MLWNGSPGILNRHVVIDGEYYQLKFNRRMEKVVSRESHKLQIVGSTPTPATNSGV